MELGGANAHVVESHAHILVHLRPKDWNLGIALTEVRQQNEFGFHANADINCL